MNLFNNLYALLNNNLFFLSKCHVLFVDLNSVCPVSSYPVPIHSLFLYMCWCWGYADNWMQQDGFEHAYSVFSLNIYKLKNVNSSSSTELDSQSDKYFLCLVWIYNFAPSHSEYSTTEIIQFRRRWDIGRDLGRVASLWDLHRKRRSWYSI